MDITVKDIESALANNAFTLHYQPKVNLLTGHVSGVEGLARWITPDKGFVSPGVFIPMAEEAGLITEISAQIVPLAAEMAVSLKEKGFGMGIAINMSPIDFESDRILNLLQTTLNQGQIDAQDLQIELTETATLENLSLIHI